MKEKILEKAFKTKHNIYITYGIAYCRILKKKKFFEK